MASTAVAPYRLSRYETEVIEQARAELEAGNLYDDAGFTLGRRQGQITCLALIIARATAAAPLRVTDGMQGVITGALGLAAIRTPDELRAWLTSHHVALAATAAGVRSLEYAAVAGAARSYVQDLDRMIGVLTRT